VRRRSSSASTAARVARLLDVGNVPTARGGQPFLVMEYLDGKDLAKVLSERSQIPWREAVRWVVDVARTLSAAHALGIVHRDVKPANVFLTADGVKLIDFGIAKVIGERGDTATKLTQANMIVGSIHYMSREQLLSSATVDARTDVWSLGVTLYELVTGRHPFEGTSELEVASKILTDRPPPLRRGAPDAPEALDALVDATLVSRPDRLPMVELTEALERILAS